MSVTETPARTQIPIVSPTATTNSTITPVQLLSGVGGAVGSGFRQSLNQLVFVEFDSGQLSALNLISDTKVVLGTGYTNPEDVKLSADGVHAYVTERSGNFVKVALSSANRSAATLVVSGLNTPQQLALDEAHNFAYVVEFAATGKLWQINLTTGAKTAILSTLNFAVGIVLSSDLQYAYIGEQTTGSDKGRISKFRLSDGSRQAIVTGLTNPFFLTWADAAFTSLYVPQRDPVNQVTRVDVVAKVANEISVVDFNPSSVALAGTTLLVCCDQFIQSINLAPVVSATDLLIGIGFIPFTDISQTTGLANTSADPGAHYPVTNVPFGGALPIMINYELANTDGATFYRVLIDGIVRMDTWTDDKWNGTTYITETMIPQVIASEPGYFPVRPDSDLLFWLHPTLGLLTDSTNLGDGKHTISVQFVNSTGTLKATSTPLVILVNNKPCVASLGAPSLNGQVDPTCGVLHYKGLTSDSVTMPVTASQPGGFATYSFEVVKGVNSVITIGNPVPAASPVTGVVSTLLGSCTVAGFGEYLYVASTINNGWSRQSQYDAAAAAAFVLTP